MPGPKPNHSSKRGHRTSPWRPSSGKPSRYPTIQAGRDDPSESRAGTDLCLRVSGLAGPPPLDTDEKAPLRAGHPEAAAKRRRHCQSTEFHVLRRSDGEHLEISVKAFLPLPQIPPGNKNNGLTSLLLRYMVLPYFETRTFQKFGTLPICTEQTKSWWLQLLNELCSREEVESPICVFSLLLDLSFWLDNAL